MKTRYFFPICIFFLLLPAGTAAADGLSSQEFRFEHLSIADGLSSSSISTIIQDRDGLLWFASQSGLNRYDGYSFERYEHDPFNRNSLSHNLIQTMYYEDPGLLWIGTYGGLNRFDTESGDFTWYPHKSGNPGTLSNNVVVAVTRDASGDLWVGTLKGLNRYNAESDSFVRYMQGDPRNGDLPNDVIRSLAVDNKGTLWVGTYGGLSRYHRESDSFSTFATDGGGRNSLPSPYVMCILPDPRRSNVLWTGTWDGGVSKINTDTGEITTYTLPHNKIYTMLFDSKGSLWAGTWGNGLYLLDPETGDFQTVHATSTEVIYSLTEDSAGIIWVGTNGGGVYKYVPWENSFRSFVHDPEDPSTIADGRIVAAFFDPDGTGWFGTYNGGLNRYDPVTHTFTRYQHDPEDPGSLSNNLVNDIFRDSKGNLWIGTNEGLNRYIPESGSFERIHAGSEEYTPPEDVVFAIAEGPSGALWLGTNTSGVAVYDHESGRYRVMSHDPKDTRSLSDNLVRTIVHDSGGNTWVGTNDGLNRYNRETNDFERYLHDIDRPGATISSDNIREIYEDSKGRIWIATMGGGVNLYNSGDNSFSYLTVKDGLASNQVMGILEDDSGKLWFPTNRGISIYDPEDDSFRLVNQSNGLLSNELTQASVQSPSGDFYIGSVRGISVIKKADTATPDFVPPIAVTGFSVLGKERKLTRIDDQSYATVVLDSADSYFAFEFSVLDYSSPDQNKYSFTLEGFDTEWTQTGRNYISYTNLDPGDYTLRIRGAGSRDNWNEQGISIPITVLPPWWRSNLAYAGYVFLAAAGIALAFFRVRRKRLEAEARIAEKEEINRQLDKKVKERTAEIEKSRTLAEEASKAKSLFLANMSHEIRTPLNGLIGMLSLLSGTTLQKQQKEYVEYSKISADNLNILVNDLLDFERIESGELKLANEKFSLRDTADYIERLFIHAFREKGLTLDIEVELDNNFIVVLGDRNRVVQVLTNLVNNALKYTLQGGVTVRIGVTEQTEGVEYAFEVEDTGVGIAEEDLERIFEHFTQLDNGYTKGSRGVGLGLAIVKQVTAAMNGTISVDSTLGKGSCFRVVLPLTPAAEAPAPDTADTGEHGAEQEAGPGKEGTEKPVILICEDEAINRLYISQHLQGLGFQIETAKDGLEAVSKAQEGRCGLILMDLGMPRISGLEAARRIRAWEEETGRKAVPIIALTAHTYAEDITKCREAGMDDFISKPVNEAQMRKTIDRWTG